MKEQLKNLKLVALSKLSAKRLLEAKRLVSHCKRSDGFEPIFYWSSIENRKNPGIHEILCYTADQKLVGYVALYHFEEHEVEVTSVVHPDHRSQEVYGLMFDHMKKVIADYPVEIKRYVFTCNHESLALKEYLGNQGASCAGFTRKLALTAHQYEKLKNQKGSSALTSESAVHLRIAHYTDIPELIQLGVKCFGVSLRDYQRYLMKAFQDPTKVIFVVQSDNKIVGKLHAHIEKKKAYLYDLCIDPEHQNQGYGGTLLCGTLKDLFEHNIRQVVIDVSDENGSNWYEKFNFKCRTTYEHWKLPVFINPLKQREKQLEELLLNFQCYQVQDQMSDSVYKH